MDHRGEALDIVMKYDPHADRQLQSEMLDVISHYLNKQPMFAMDPNVWRAVGALLHDEGLLKAEPDINAAADFSFANQ